MYERVDPTTPHTPDATPITVYTLPTCVHCVRAKALLARRGIPYEEVDVNGVPAVSALATC